MCPGSAEFCVNKGNVKSTGNDGYGYSYTGGVVGRLSDLNGLSGSVISSANYGGVTGSYQGIRWGMWNWRTQRIK